MLIPMAAQYKVWVCGRPFVGIVDLNPAKDMDVCLSVVSVVCCQVEVSAMVCTVVQRSPTEHVCALSVIKCNSHFLHIK
jgi:hypothetical protein